MKYSLIASDIGTFLGLIKSTNDENSINLDVYIGIICIISNSEK